MLPATNMATSTKPAYRIFRLSSDLRIDTRPLFLIVRYNKESAAHQAALRTKIENIPADN
jgi:hypothetical protein